MIWQRQIKDFLWSEILLREPKDEIVLDPKKRDY
jgi:hypothetical protein